MDVARDRGASRHEPGSLSVIDLSRPVDVRAGGDSDHQRGIGLEMPKRTLPLGQDAIDRAVELPHSSRAGYGGLLAADLLARAAGQRPGGRAALAPRHPATRPATAGAGLHRAERPPTRAVPRDIAAAHHLSAGYLHHLVQADGTTIAAEIRRRRPAGAHRDPADPEPRALTIHHLALRRGFSSHPDAAYGTTPGNHRRRAAVEAESSPGRRTVKETCTDGQRHHTAPLAQWDASVLRGKPTTRGGDGRGTVRTVPRPGGPPPRAGFPGVAADVPAGHPRSAKNPRTSAPAAQTSCGTASPATAGAAVLAAQEPGA
ncbi:hypothetical protein GCM10022245_47990 [Streptomyces mayteni]